jgi:hypothetical protein
MSDFLYFVPTYIGITFEEKQRLIVFLAEQKFTFLFIEGYICVAGEGPRWIDAFSMSVCSV